MYAIGIDMSKDSFHACFEHDKVRKFSNTDDGIEEFMTSMEEYGFLQDNTRIGVEATGSYHLLLAVTLTEHSWDVYVINPLESHKMITGSLRVLKTDRTDAMKIREMTILEKGYLFSETLQIVALKTLVIERRALVGMRKSTKQRMQATELKSGAFDMPLHDSFSAVIETLEKTIKQTEDCMKEYEKDTQDLLQSIPGVGLVSAAMLVAFIGDIHRFSKPEKLVAYIGLDSRTYESGTSVRGKGYISK